MRICYIFLFLGLIAGLKAQEPGLTSQQPTIQDSSLTTLAPPTTTPTTNTKEIKCFIQNRNWNFFPEPLKECAVKDQAISTPGFYFSTPEDGSVQALSFRNNKEVYFIPEQISQKFRNLIGLSFNNCSLKSVTHRNLENLQKLKSLYLSYNQIETIESGAFKDLVALEHISLNENRLEFLSSNLFVFNSMLKTIYATGNRIEALGEKLFDSLKNLDELHLKENKIRFLHDEIFKNLINVKNISLKNNQLTEVKEVHFKKNTKLCKIWLDNNKIKYVNAKAFDNKKNLIYVDLTENTCINKVYRTKQFADMKKDLKQKCLPMFEKVNDIKAENTKIENKINTCLKVCPEAKKKI